MAGVYKRITTGAESENAAGQNGGIPAAAPNPKGVYARWVAEQQGHGVKGMYGRWLEQQEAKQPKTMAEIQAEVDAELGITAPKKQNVPAAIPQTLAGMEAQDKQYTEMSAAA